MSKRELTALEDSNHDTGMLLFGAVCAYVNERCLFKRVIYANNRFHSVDCLANTQPLWPKSYPFPALTDIFVDLIKIIE